MIVNYVYFVYETNFIHVFQFKIVINKLNIFNLIDILNIILCDKLRGVEKPIPFLTSLQSICI